MNTEITQMSIYIILVIAIVVILLIVGRSFALWWLGTGEIAKNQEEMIRLLKIIADKPPTPRPTGPASAPQSVQSPRRSP